MSSRFGLARFVILQPGDTQQFTATALEQFGQPIDGGDVAWSPISTYGTLSDTGLFTASDELCSSSHTIYASDGDYYGTAQVKIVYAPADGELWHADLNNVAYTAGTGNTLTVNSPPT